MAQNLDLSSNTVRFLYPEKYRQEYTNLLAKHGVKLESIETFLQKHASDELINDVKDIYERPQECVQTYITSKDALAFAVVYKEGGYVFDTNIVPDDRYPLNLPEPEILTYPKVKDNYTTAIDVWARAGKAGDRTSKDLLYEYLAQWDAVQNTYSDKTTKSYYDDCAFILGAMLNSFARELETDEFKTWETQTDSDVFSSGISSLGIMKFYFNTHTFEKKMRTSKELIRETLGYCICNKSHKALFKFMVKTINSDITQQDQNGLSLLHYIAMFNSPRYLHILISSKNKSFAKLANTITNNGMTALHYAAINIDKLDDVKLFSKLIRLGVPLSKKADFSNCSLGWCDHLENKAEVKVKSILKARIASGIENDAGVKKCLDILQKAEKEKTVCGFFNEIRRENNRDNIPPCNDESEPVKVTQMYL